MSRKLKISAAIFIVVSASLYAYSHYKTKLDSDNKSKRVQIAFISLAGESLKCMQFCQANIEVWGKSIKLGADVQSNLNNVQNNNYALVKDIDNKKQEMESLVSTLRSSYGQESKEMSSLLDMYKSYCKIYSCAKNPSGSFMSYSKEVSDMMSDLTSQLEMAKVTIGFDPKMLRKQKWD